MNLNVIPIRDMTTQNIWIRAAAKLKLLISPIRTRAAVMLASVLRSRKKKRMSIIWGR